MPQQAVSAESGGVRCTRCGAAVVGTCHTRMGYTVGHYVLHTGTTEDATVRRRDDEAPITYRRLVEPVEVVTCPTCFARPDVRLLWSRFGDAERAA
ncbi:MAG TPA: hypothetical protein VKA21_11705 [Candidatus Binatia bacterium]|nr:hypothetical protein [Candidatus Binatia bacterium]